MTMLNTKFFFILVVWFATCESAIDPNLLMKFVQKLKNVTEECINETKATPDDIRSLFLHKIPSSHEGKCLIFCFFKHFDVQTENGSVNEIEAIPSLEHIKEHNEEIYKKVIEIFSTCKVNTVKDNDPCIYSSNLLDCAIQEGKKMGIDEFALIE